MAGIFLSLWWDSALCCSDTDANICKKVFTLHLQDTSEKQIHFSFKVSLVSEIFQKEGLIPQIVQVGQAMCSNDYMETLAQQFSSIFFLTTDGFT